MFSQNIASFGPWELSWTEAIVIFNTWLASTFCYVNNFYQTPKVVVHKVEQLIKMEVSRYPLMGAMLDGSQPRCAVAERSSVDVLSTEHKSKTHCRVRTLYQRTLYQYLKLRTIIYVSCTNVGMRDGSQPRLGWCARLVCLLCLLYFVCLVCACCALFVCSVRRTYVLGLCCSGCCAWSCMCPIVPAVAAAPPVPGLRLLCKLWLRAHRPRTWTRASPGLCFCFGSGSE